MLAGLEGIRISPWGDAWEYPGGAMALSGPLTNKSKALPWVRPTVFEALDVPAATRMRLRFGSSYMGADPRRSSRLSA